MKLSSIQIEAFFETAQRRSFSKAAKALGLTQSALSQRVANLERELEVTLFIRDPKGPVLTSTGEQFLRYCQATRLWEQEVLGQMKSSSKVLAGSVRVAAFSSVLRSAIIPSLSPLLRTHPFVHFEFRSFEVIDLYSVLRNAQADFVILDYHLHQKGVVEHKIGEEEYVVIESTKHKSPENLYLDHGPLDNATESYFRSQAQFPKNLKRSFMGDVYSIITGVEHGLGRAVMSKHLLKNNTHVRMISGYKKYTRPVTLNYFEQPYYSELQKQVIRCLNENAKNYL